MELTKEQKLLQDIVYKAWDDKAFKQELVANPVKAIETLIGRPVNLPKDKTIVVQDQTNDAIVYINIPSNPNMDDMELNEQQLDIIAGGGRDSDPVITDPAANLAQL